MSKTFEKLFYAKKERFLKLIQILIEIRKMVHFYVIQIKIERCFKKGIANFPTTI